MIGHLCPEAAHGGPLSIVQNGDIISIDMVQRSINLEITAEEIKARQAAWHANPPKSKLPDGYHGVLSKYAASVGMAHSGAIVEDTIRTKRS